MLQPFLEAGSATSWYKTGCIFYFSKVQMKILCMLSIKYANDMGRQASCEMMRAMNAVVGSDVMQRMMRMEGEAMKHEARKYPIRNTWA
jgi:hypothetical protein